MNIILFYAPEVELPLLRHDPRAVHLLDVLRRRPGDSFDAGLIDGPRGKGTLVSIDRETLALSFVWAGPPPPPSPITLLIGLPRPQTARAILRETTALGVAALHFIRTEKGEASYARSTLWQSGEWKTHLIAGAAQAFCTRLPELTHGHSLVECLTALPAAPARLTLDNYESPVALSAFDPAGRKSAILAVGAERGWSATERKLLRQGGFAFVHLGPRVLRTETACLAAVILLKARLGLI